MTCFICQLPVTNAWPPAIAYIVMDGGPALPEHNDCRLHHPEGRTFPQGVDHEEERHRLYHEAAGRLVVAA